jgi:hypothetical protein
MTINLGDSRGSPRSQPAPPACGQCGDDRHLDITAIDALPADFAEASPGSLVEVTFRCTRCGIPFTQPADVTEVARILNRAGSTANVLAFGGHYVHCGQPMQAAGGAMRNLFRGYMDRELPDTLGVYLATRVLRCVCGFQMEIPDGSPAAG